ncbi:MAG: divergent polysaccharide deacetylase family protein [Fibrobacter sp.]|nr:divergent polysaccharide deacetylase family protein [Fibrobacter sp.]
MNKVKHILAIFIVLAVLAAVAYFLPQTEFGAKILPTSHANTDVTADSLTVRDTIPFIDQFKGQLEVIQASYSKRKKRDIWTLGKGRTIIYYLLQAQRFLKANGGHVLYMEELHDDPSTQAALLDAISPTGDSLHITLQVSENVFRDNASYLSIAFQVTRMTPEFIVALNQLDFPYDLMVTPFGMGDGFFPDLKRVKNKEIVLWLLMESQSLDSRHNKLRPIRIHHTEQQIENIINEAKSILPDAKGIATRFADQAVEHRQLLQATFEPIKEQGLWFVDLSMNQKSKVDETCEDFGIKCKILSPYNPSNSALDDYVTRTLRAASKSGMAAMILPLNTESIAKVKTMKEKAARQGTTIVNLSTFMKY